MEMIQQLQTGRLMLFLSPDAGSNNGLVGLVTTFSCIRNIQGPAVLVTQRIFLQLKTCPLYL
jgi:phage gpG-like protein